MSRDEFIFSNKPLIRISRHLAFWTTDGFFFWIQSIMPENYESFFSSDPYKNAFFSWLCFMPPSILLMYVCIYWILPRYLIKQKYIMSMLAFLCLFLIGLGLYYLTSELYLKLVIFNNLIQSEWLIILTENKLMNLFILALNNLTWAICISGIALGIKFSKNWYLQQQEYLLLMHNKFRNEIQIQKAQIQPAYLSRTLKNIHTHIQFDVKKAATIIVKLSELLSYSLYESQDKRVLLEKEIKVLQDFIFLEQSRAEGCVNIYLKVLGSAKNKFLPPMLILSIFQEGLALINHSESNSFKASIIINAFPNVLNVQYIFSELLIADKSILWNSLYEKAKQKLDYSCGPDDYELNLLHTGNFKDYTLTFNINNFKQLIVKEDIYEPA